jgi:hypothetical protein
VPLSLPQEQMWFIESRANPPGLYNMTVHVRIDDGFDRGCLLRTIRYLADRHEALRTALVSASSGQPHQLVLPAVDIALDETDLRSLHRSERSRELQRVLLRENRQPIDVTEAPLFRSHAVRLEDTTTEVIVTFDHVIFDRTSSELYITEFTQVYQGIRSRGVPPPMPALPTTYAAYSLSQRSHLTEDRAEQQLHFWRRYLAGVSMTPLIPFDKVPDRPSRGLAGHTFTLSGAEYDLLRQMLLASGATEFILCVAAVAILLHWESGRTDVLISTTLDGRTHKSLFGVIGDFTIVTRIRMDLGGNPTIGQVIAQARHNVVNVLRHGDLPFYRVRQAVFPALQRATADPYPLAKMPVEISYFRSLSEQRRRASLDHPLGATEDDLAERVLPQGQVQPVTAVFANLGSGLEVTVRAKTNCYESATVARLGARLEAVFRAIVGARDVRLSETVDDLSRTGVGAGSSSSDQSRSGS